MHFISTLVLRPKPGVCESTNQSARLVFRIVRGAGTIKSVQATILCNLPLRRSPLSTSNLPRMDSNHDKVIQSHLSLASVACQEFRGGKPGKQKLSKISFDSFRAKFRPNR